MNATADVSALLREAEKHGSAVVPVDTLLAIVDAAEHHKAQRDALLAALESIAHGPTSGQWIDGSRDRAGRGAEYVRPTKENIWQAYDQIIHEARAAIAKVRGEA